MPSRPRQLTFHRIALLIVLACAAPAAQADAALQRTSTLTWSLSGDWFGGFSGAEVSGAGRSITLVTDRGTLAVASMIRDEDGRLTALDLQRHAPMTDASGKAMKGRFTDAEGLAIGADGQAYVSFEHAHRVSRLDIASARTRTLIDSAGLATMQPNSGLEALAIHPDGTLYALPERSGALTRPFPLYALRGDTWEIVGQIPRRGPFLAVGADFDAAGRLYLLERATSPLGFRSRIRRFDLAAPDLSESTLLTSWPGQYDNLEALSVWRDAAGRTWITVVSDDNFFAIQRTQIVEFVLTE